MERIVYIFQGYDNDPRNNRAYREIANAFKNKGFHPVLVDILWQHNTISEYIQKFMKKYKNLDNSFFFGFSFGSDVCFILSTIIKPKLQFYVLYPLSLRKTYLEFRLDGRKT